MRPGLVVCALLMIAASGCAKKVDVEVAREELRTADQSWLEAASSKDADAFVGFVTAEGSILPPHETIVTGTDAVRQWAAGLLASPGFSLIWNPTSVDVAASGDLGYTLGTYDLEMQGPGGAMMNDHGKYITIWRKEPDGQWRVVADTFNSDVPMPAMASTDTTATMTQ